MPKLHETRMGQQLITSTLPRIATALEEIAEALAKKPEPAAKKPEPAAAPEVLLEKVLKETAPSRDTLNAVLDICIKHAEDMGLDTIIIPDRAEPSVPVVDAETNTLKE
jgi:hypothetical protein